MGIKFVGKAKLTKQGQVTLPLEARKNMNLDSDNEIYWYQVDNHLVAVKELVSTKELEKIISKKRG